MRLVLDTNTVVSGLLWDGLPRRLQEAARTGDAALYTSPVLLAELARVLGRAKFLKPIARTGIALDELIEGYAGLAKLVRPAPIPRAVIADPDDDHVLACAVAAQADLIVSGDSDLLELHAYQGMPIVRPIEALRRIERP